MKIEGKCRCGFFWKLPTKPKIDGACGCGRCYYHKAEEGISRPSDYTWQTSKGVGEWYADTYCSHCGYHLADDGCAYEVVRKDSVVETDTAFAQEWSEEAIAGRVADPLLWIEAAQDALSMAAEHIKALDPADEGSDDE